ncbi:MAG TPA: methionyl-tRNA formyltransferase [Actinomycetota bacterium]|nr:methionyl-tRNA formyltransferase [Actinomycetota bacterium]
MSARVVFLGSKRIGLRCLEVLCESVDARPAAVITIDDTADARSVLGEFRAFCEARAIPLIVADNRHAAEESILELHPELCVVVGWYWIIPSALLSSVPLGFVGLHGSLLPKYRGGSPLVWAIINGETEAGITLFSFTEGMDDGPVWGRHRIPIGPDDTIGDVLAHAEDGACSLLAKHIPAIAAGSTAMEKQNEAHATYCAMRKPEDGEIDWSWPAPRIHDFIRAQTDPYPGAFTHRRDELVRIWRAKQIDETYYGVPGQIVRFDETSVWVTCGDHKPLALVTVQVEGDARVPARAALASLNLRLR